jgi:hypothetical protein
MLQNLRIASPCSAHWDRMAGDDLVRYCPECKLSVYNFSEMTEAEIKRIAARREGRLCARFYQRTDGTLITRNCPVGFRRAIVRISRLATAALTAVMTVSPILARPGPERLTPALLLQIKEARAAFSVEVIDQTGAGIAEAQITLLNEATQKKLEARTDASGRLRMADVAAGSYLVTIESPGFANGVTPHVAVPHPDTIKVTLLIGGLMGEIVCVQKPNMFHRFVSGLRRIL